MIHRLTILPFLTITLLGLFLFAHFVSAATTADVAARKAALEKDLQSLEVEIEAQTKILQERQRESVSLERDVAIFDAKINKAELGIKARNISINQLGQGISSKESTIGQLNQKLNREKQSLAQLVRKTNEIDSYSTIEVVLGNQNLSELFIDLDSFDAVESALQDSFEFIEDTKDTTQKEKTSLEEKQSEEVELRSIQRLQKQRIEEDKAEKNRILKITKGKESVYQKIIKDIEKDAVAIRSELFALRGSAAIPFAKALEYANMVSKKTGVRPAFILGVITEESNLGENVGQCLLTNEPRKGDGKGANTGRHFSGVMKGSRDVDPFMAITSKLGISPYSQVVSCPPSYGYGGAMGPAQFIPSTWVLYEKRIAKSTGHNPPNPWEPEDAFTASAILLMDNGADKGTYAAERLAALRYLAGWRNATKPAYAFYGDDVMYLAAKYQKQIDILEGR